MGMCTLVVQRIQAPPCHPLQPLINRALGLVGHWHNLPVGCTSMGLASNYFVPRRYHHPCLDSPLFPFFFSSANLVSSSITLCGFSSGPNNPSWTPDKYSL